MSTGRHRNGRSTTPVAFYAGLVAVPVGLIMLVAALVELFHYSPYGNPGALAPGVFLAAGGILLVGIPVLVTLAKILKIAHRDYTAWKRTLTPAERTMLTLGELGALTGMHLLWRDHNRARAAELTASAMGETSLTNLLPDQPYTSA